MDDSEEIAQRDVLKRVLDSSVPGLPRGSTGVLEELCRRYWAKEFPLKAHEVELFSNQTFSKTDEDQTGVVRVFFSRIRSALKQYFQSGGGKSEVWVLAIPPGRSEHDKRDYGAYTVVWSKRKEAIADIFVNGGIVIQELRAKLLIEKNGDATIRYEIKIQNLSSTPLHGREVDLWFEHPQPQRLKIRGMLKDEYPVDIEVVRDYQNSKHYFLHFPYPVAPGEASSYWWELQAHRVFRDHHYWDLRIPASTERAILEITHRLPNKTLTRTELHIRSAEGSFLHSYYPFEIQSRVNPIRFLVSLSGKAIPHTATARWYYQ